MKRYVMIIAVAWGLLAGAAAGETLPTALSADEIIEKANHMSLYQGADVKGSITMVITDAQGRKRERRFNMLRKDSDDLDKDQKYFVFFKSPADVRKMVFMVHKHAALGKDDDRWLYMPSLDLVKRIAASDKRTSFVGSDFLYEDISGRNPKADYHEILSVTGQYYVLKNTPKEPGSVEFAYYIVHIDRGNFLLLKMAYYKSDDRCYRTIITKKIENITVTKNGSPVSYPTVTRSVAENLENRSRTEMIFSKVRYDVGIDDRVFTERYLRRPPRDAIR